MRTVTGLLVLVAGLGPAWNAARAGEPTPTTEHIQQLIKRLDHPQAAERVKARVELEAIGPAALPALQQAAQGDNAEVSRSARELIATVEKTAAFIAPRKVRLKVADAPVADALDQLSKQSGFPIKMRPAQKDHLQRKITLDTGEVTFWQAFDQLCARAGLVDAGVGNGGPARIKQQLPPEQAAASLAAEKRIETLNVILDTNDPRSAAAQAAVEALPKAYVEAARLRKGMQGPVYWEPAQLFVKAGAASPLPTCYAGSVRLRVVKAARSKDLGLEEQLPGQVVVVVEMTPEPRFQNFFADFPLLEKSDLKPIDPKTYKGRPLDMAKLGAAQEDTNDIRRFAVLRFADDGKATELRDLAGAASCLMDGEITETSFKDVLKAAGEKLRLPRGHTVELVSIEKQKGDYRVQISSERPGGFLPTLLDDKGQPFARLSPKPDVYSYHPQRGQGEPDRLVFYDQQPVRFPVRFSFEKVPLGK
jgi:hypothetical protein